MYVTYKYGLLVPVEVYWRVAPLPPYCTVHYSFPVHVGVGSWVLCALTAGLSPLYMYSDIDKVITYVPPPPPLQESSPHIL